MKKLELLALAAATAGILSLTSVSQDAQAADAACVRKEFKTNLVKDACTKGGQCSQEKNEHGY